mmetsp:Transcript_82371/g.146050  ORF Transcript_82371/g.146050 Transcript_82371/m.146050 type:complete len:217 (+) Transcript_82371:3-653(+)
MLFEALVMGFSAQMSVVSFTCARLLKPTFKNFICTLVAIMVMILIVSFAFAIIFELVEKSGLDAAFFFMISQVCGIQSLSATGPRTEAGLLIAGLSTVNLISLGGVIIGVLGAHDWVLRLVELVEGISAEDLDAAAAAAAETGETKVSEEFLAAASRVSELERKVEELQQSLRDKSAECEELQRDLHDLDGTMMNLVRACRDAAIKQKVGPATTSV